MVESVRKLEAEIDQLAEDRLRKLEAEGFNANKIKANARKINELQAQGLDASKIERETEAQISEPFDKVITDLEAKKRMLEEQSKASARDKRIEGSIWDPAQQAGINAAAEEIESVKKEKRKLLDVLHNNKPSNPVERPPEDIKAGNPDNDNLLKEAQRIERQLKEARDRADNLQQTYSNVNMEAVQKGAHTGQQGMWAIIFDIVHSINMNGMWQILRAYKTLAEAELARIAALEKEYAHLAKKTDPNSIRLRDQRPNENTTELSSLPVDSSGVGYQPVLTEEPQEITIASNPPAGTPPADPVLTAAAAAAPETPRDEEFHAGVGHRPAAAAP